MKKRKIAKLALQAAAIKRTARWQPCVNKKCAESKLTNYSVTPDLWKNGTKRVLRTGRKTRNVNATAKASN